MRAGFRLPENLHLDAVEFRPRGQPDVIGKPFTPGLGFTEKQIEQPRDVAPRQP
jgi:hypothetical protein